MITLKYDFNISVKLYFIPFKCATAYLYFTSMYLTNLSLFPCDKKFFTLLMSCRICVKLLFLGYFSQNCLNILGTIGTKDCLKIFKLSL